MARWDDVLGSEHGFATRVRAVMDAQKHKTLATLRAGGAPRISGIEVSFLEGELLLGSMGGSRKSADLVRDPRFALHSGSVAPQEGAEADWPGDAKLSGLAVLVEGDDAARLLAASGAPPDQPADLFRADLREVVLTRVGDPPDHLVIELWRPGLPLRRFRRY